jgi:hypothetical protein
VVKRVFKKVKPKHGFAHIFHFVLVAVMPILAYIFIRLDIVGLAVAIVVLSKWRMLAISPRHWLAHLRSNAVDIIVSLALVSFMIVTNFSGGWLQIVWLALFEVWVLLIKPREAVFMVSIQALIAQALGMVAMFLVFETAPLAVYVLGALAISYFSARHFLNSYEEPNEVAYSWLWAFFAACLVWILAHWLLFYKSVAQPAVILGVIGYGLAGLYYLHEHDKLTNLVRRQIIFVVFALIFVMIVLSNWGEGIIK